MCNPVTSFSVSKSGSLDWDWRLYLGGKLGLDRNDTEGVADDLGVLDSEVGRNIGFGVTGNGAGGGGNGIGAGLRGTGTW